MMKWLSHWRKQLDYSSLLRLESDLFPGVEFSLRRISLAQRIELASRVRELTLRNEFLRAGSMNDQVEAGIADLLVRKLYLEWAVAELKGLKIDGKPGSLNLLIDHGPELLTGEIFDAIREHLELSETERKNF